MYYLRIFIFFLSVLFFKQSIAQTRVELGLGVFNFIRTLALIDSDRAFMHHYLLDLNSRLVLNETFALQAEMGAGRHINLQHPTTRFTNYTDFLELYYQPKFKFLFSLNGRKDDNINFELGPSIAYYHSQKIIHINYIDIYGTSINRRIENSYSTFNAGIVQRTSIYTGGFGVAIELSLIRLLNNKPELNSVERLLGFKMDEGSAVFLNFDFEVYYRLFGK
ncbi:MAG: hypothetical protein MUC81_09830 [Bacteroidia bacterium]|jgi:hypothetical protein|nr:hypothetical protein [Bacteroidia bacterium]